MTFSSSTQALEMPRLDGVGHSAVRARGVRFHLAEAGDANGEPVLCLHGWPQHWFEWRDLLAVPPAGIRILAPDLPGYGWSGPAPHRWSVDDVALDLVALLDELGIDRVLLVGHDWGGVVGYALALHAPDRVRGYMALNILHPWNGPREMLPHVPRMMSYQVPILLFGMTLFRRTNYCRLALRKAGSERPVFSPEEEATFVESFRAPTAARSARSSYRTAWREAPHRARNPERRRLTMPLRILHGTGDVAIHRALVDPGPNNVDDYELSWIDGCGHFIVDERPELIRSALLELDAAAT